MQRHVCVYIRGSVKSYKEMRAKKTVIYLDKNVIESVERQGKNKERAKREKDICSLVLKIYYTDEKAVGGRETRGNKKNEKLESE